MTETPTRSEIQQIIDRLISAELSREAASDWATEHHVEVAADPVVEEALDILALIDARHVSGDGRVLDYMYDFADLSLAREALASDGAA